MTAFQLELPFIHEDPDLKVCRAIEHIESRFEKNRKALHMKNGMLQSKITELEHKFAMLEAALCKSQMEFKF